jgi:predicted DNA-binding transcriptional regulator YafY
VGLIVRYDLKRSEAHAKVELLLEAATTGLTVYDIAESLGCHHSTAHRIFKDIERERLLIEVTRGHYRLDPIESVRNVRLHPSEALTIYLALRRFIRQTSKAPDFMISALQKIIPALRRPDLVDQLLQSTHLLRETRAVSDEYEQIWQTIIHGWLHGEVVRIAYRGLDDAAATEHVIEPYLFEPMPFGDGTYLIAWSRTRGALRTFKPDRIQQARLTNETFEKRALDVDHLLRCAFGIWYGAELHDVELIFPPRLARRMMESTFLPNEQKDVLADGSLRWRAQVSGLLEIRVWVRSWAHEVRVIAPEQLRQDILSDLRAALAQYGEG